jgi:putative ABC transport system ATP-binding protein
MESIISIENVSKIYSKGPLDFKALDNINLNIKKGEFLAITGKSGCGKSSLLNLIAGLDSISKGEIKVGEISLSKLSESRLSKWRGKNIGVVFQFFQLIPTLTGLENILLAMDFAGKFPLIERKERSMLLLKSLGIENQSDKYPAIMSGGEQQRCAIARACANDPDIIVADEPTGNLDSTNSLKIFDYFSELNEKGKTIVMVTHDKDFAKNAKKSISMKDGTLEVSGVNL